jgi:3-methyladenine DNA glycosylase AlkD
MRQTVAQTLEKLKNPAKARFLQQFFKTGPGEYGEGDVFLGITVPQQRAVAKQFKDADFTSLRKLLKSPVHEYRLTALIILTLQYQGGDLPAQKKIFDFYLKQRAGINNWDLVDVSAPYIVGEYLLGRDSAILFRLAHSKRIWDRRIAILAAFAFIKSGDFEVPLRLAEILVFDAHDLMQKAVGWMLREVGKRSLKAEEAFLHKYAAIMPRTMLRYAIERFPEKKRLRYLRLGS